MQEVGLGRLLKTYRAITNIKEEAFAGAILTSKVSFYKLENLASVSDISDDMLFRLFYFFKLKRDDDMTANAIKNQILISITKEINARSLKNSLTEDTVSLVRKLKL